METCHVEQLQFKIAWLFDSRPVKYMSIWRQRFGYWLGKIQRLITTRWLYSTHNGKKIMAHYEHLCLFAQEMYEKLESSDVNHRIWCQVATWLLIKQLVCQLIIITEFGRLFLEAEFQWTESGMRSTACLMDSDCTSSSHSRCAGLSSCVHSGLTQGPISRTFSSTLTTSV